MKFDEPASALDPTLVREVATLLRALDDLNKTLLVVFDGVFPEGPNGAN